MKADTIAVITGVLSVVVATAASLNLVSSEKRSGRPRRGFSNRSALIAGAATFAATAAAAVALLFSTTTPPPDAYGDSLEPIPTQKSGLMTVVQYSKSADGRYSIFGQEKIIPDNYSIWIFTSGNGLYIPLGECQRSDGNFQCVNIPAELDQGIVALIVVSAPAATAIIKKALSEPAPTGLQRLPEGADIGIHFRLPD